RQPELQWLQQHGGGPPLRAGRERPGRGRAQAALRGDPATHRRGPALCFPVDAGEPVGDQPSRRRSPARSVWRGGDQVERARMVYDRRKVSDPAGRGGRGGRRPARPPPPRRIARLLALTLGDAFWYIRSDGTKGSKF